MLTKSNAIGYAVLSLVIAELDELEVRDFVVEPYLNGRESGFAVILSGRSRSHRHDRKLVFSELRGSDAIIVYEAASHEFSMQGNGLTDKIYAAGTSFERSQICRCALHIVERMCAWKTKQTAEQPASEATAHSPVAAWQPITTAPKDGTYVLLAGDSGYVGTPLRVEVCRHDSDYRPLSLWVNYAGDAFTDGGGNPLFWMQLPAMPGGAVYADTKYGRKACES